MPEDKILKKNFNEPWDHLLESQRMENFREERGLIPDLHIFGYLDFRKALKGGLRPAVHTQTDEITYITRGKAKWWIQNQSYELKAGDLLIVPRGTLHWGEGFNLEPIESYWFRIKIPEKGSLRSLNLKETQMIREVLTKPGRHSFPGVPELGPLFSALLKEHQKPAFLSPLVAQHLLYQILFLIVRSHAIKNRQETPLSSAESQISEILNYIQKNCLDQISIKSIAQHARMSPNDLRSLFYRKLKTTPNDYILSLKFNLAKNYLLDEKKSITWIAFELGFNSSQYFSTFFYKYSGMSPSEFRLKMNSPDSSSLPQKPFVVDA